MYYVYVLKSQKDNKLYTGHTENLKRRLSQHNSGKVKSTSTRRPFILVYSETFPTRSEARWKERFLKTAWGKKQLKIFLENYSSVAQSVERVAVDIKLAASDGNIGVKKRVNSGKPHHAFLRKQEWGAILSQSFAKGQAGLPAEALSPTRQSRFGDGAAKAGAETRHSLPNV